MSKSERAEYPESNVGQEDVPRFENYEEHGKTKYFEKLKKKDIMNYIEDIKQKCHLEVTSDDEDCTGARKSSSCSVKCCADKKSKLLKKITSKVTPKKKKNFALKKKKKKQSFNRDVANPCDYFCSAEKSHSYNNFNYVRKNSVENLDTFTQVPPRKSVYQYPNSSRNFYKHHKSSPRFSEWHSKKSYKTYPAVTKMTSLDVTGSSFQNAAHDFRIKRSNTINKKSAGNRAFELPRRNKIDNSRHVNISQSANEKTTRRNLSCYSHNRETETEMRKLNKESSDSDFENQQLLDKIYSGRDTMFSYQAPLQKRGCKGRYTSRYRYPLKKFRQPTSRSLSSRSNRLTALARLPATSSLLLQSRTSRSKNEMELPLKASSYVMGASIDRNYRRETNRKNNMDQRRRRAAVLGDGESLCYRNPGLLRKSRKLYPRKVAPTREDKQWLGCYCDGRDEPGDRSRYCCCQKNANDLNIKLSKRVDCTEASRRSTLSKLLRSRDNNEESNVDLSTDEDSRSESTVNDSRISDICHDVRNNYENVTHLNNLKPRVLFQDDRSSNKAAEEWKKLRNDSKSSQEEAVKIQTVGKRLSFAVRTPEKSAPGDSSGLRYDAAELTCECKEPFHDPPAACLIDSCTCVGNTERNDGDSSRETICCCCCCCCTSSSSTFRNENDPVKKLESFCERVKAVNQDIFHKSSKFTCRNITRTDSRKYARSDSDEQDQYEFNAEKGIRGVKSTEREWLTDPSRLRLEKLKRSHGGASLERILIYPPRGEGGPPLTLYKRSSNISCRVKGDADTGFCYDVIYVQKFASRKWTPELSPEILSRDKECSCSADYG